MKATKFQGDTALTIPHFFINAGRGTTRIWGETVATMQPTVINWGGLNKTEQQQLEPLLTTTENCVLLDQPLGKKITAFAPFRGAKIVASAGGGKIRHKD